MKVGIAKEPTTFLGGFEMLIAKIAASLTERGHEVGPIEPVAIGDRFHTIPESVRSRSPEYFHYVEQIERFRRASSDFDVVLSTQPPSQAVGHEKQVALFYHHFRQYYDLSDVWVEAGFSDPDDHRICERSIRTLDRDVFARTARFLAGSETVKRRLERFNGAGAITDVLRAPPLRPLPEQRAHAAAGAHVLCVSRHEFPKRTELGAAAMKIVPDLEAVFVGAGGRLGWLMAQDRLWTRMSPQEVAELPAEAIWLRRHTWLPESDNDPDSNIRFVGWTSDDDLEQLYREASCVIAPAYNEDYGLTALEAMAHGVPVVVCSDGGGLAETIIDGENGLVVSPDHNAIAAAVTRLNEDRDLATALGQNGRETVMEMRWEPYLDRIEMALEAQT